MFDDIDDGARVGVWVSIGLIAFLLFGLLGGLGVRQMHQRTALAPAPSAAPVPAEEALLDGPVAGDLAATLYFAVGQATLPDNAAAELAKLRQALDAAPARKLVLAGYHDASGDPAKNAELAKARAKAVRAALTEAGVAASRIALRKPESTTAEGPAEAARRVEARLVD
jgi:outer membrane protein OmpA-like peptidoglycan-associated protein